jgi:diguanylate cyclase
VEALLEDQQQMLLAKALEVAANAIFITDREGRIIWLNDAFSQLCGYSKEEAIGQTPRLLSSGKQDSEFYRSLWETILSGRSWQGELIERRRDGSLYAVHEVITPIIDNAGQITHFLACQYDVTAHTQEEEKIRQLAYHDSLTGLPNRTLFLDRLSREINHARNQHSQCAVLFLDLDHFKKVNDTLGHAWGDRLLVAAAGRFRAAVRKADTIARLGGDEFAILFADFDESETAGALAEKLVALIRQPFMLEQQKIEISVSIGISLYPRDGESVEALLNCADAAMYRAKKQGRSAYCSFDPTVDLLVEYKPLAEK